MDEKKGDRRIQKSQGIKMTHMTLKSNLLCFGNIGIVINNFCITTGQIKQQHIRKAI